MAPSCHCPCFQSKPVMLAARLFFSLLFPSFYCPLAFLSRRGVFRSQRCCIDPNHVETTVGNGPPWRPDVIDAAGCRRRLVAAESNAARGISSALSGDRFRGHTCHTSALRRGGLHTLPPVGGRCADHDPRILPAWMQRRSFWTLPQDHSPVWQAARRQWEMEAPSLSCWTDMLQDFYILFPQEGDQTGRIRLL